MRLLLLFLLLPALALSCRESRRGIRHCDESSLSAAEVLTGMRNTLDKATNASRLWLSKQLLHNLETTLRTFIVDFEAQINVDSQQLETQMTTVRTTSTSVKPTTTTAKNEPRCPIHHISIEQFPRGLGTYEHMTYEVEDGHFHLKCRVGSFHAGQLGAGAKVFSFRAGEYMCNDVTKKWTNSDGDEAPPFLGCAGYPIFPSLPMSSIWNHKTKDVSTYTLLWQGEEQYCEVGKQLQFADGTSIKSIAIIGPQNLGAIAGQLEIVVGNGTLFRFGFPDLDRIPTLKCIPKQHS